MGFRIIAAVLAVSAALSATSAVRAETRSLKIYHVNSHESWDIPFKKDGRYLPDGLKKLNHALRDWRTGQETKMDPRLLDAVWTAWKQSGSKGPIHVIGGYRSPGTNSMLRSRSTNSGVAENSQHVKGRAMDFFIPDVSLKKMREIGLRLQAGGIGYYPRSGSPFVHMDVGNVRHWPRMSRKELVAVFPNGGTLHVPSDGRPLPGYEHAMAVYKARGGAPSVMMADAGSDRDEDKPSFLAALFGGGRKTAAETAVAEVKRPARTAPPAVEPAARPVPAAVPEPEKRDVPEAAPAAPAESVLVASTKVPVPTAAPTDVRLAYAVAAAEAAATRVAAVVPSSRPAPVATVPVPDEGDAFAALLARRAGTAASGTRALAYGAVPKPGSAEGSLNALEGLVATAAPPVATPVSFDPTARVLSLTRAARAMPERVAAIVPEGKSSRVRRGNSTMPPAPTALFALPAGEPDPARFGDLGTAPAVVAEAGAGRVR